MILANNITCRRGNKIIFRNLNFKIEDGIATIISGKNGSGKTSLLRIVANLLKRWKVVKKALVSAEIIFSI